MTYETFVAISNSLQDLLHHIRCLALAQTTFIDDGIEELPARAQLTNYKNTVLVLES
jgi:hypothetical protein